MLALLLRQLQLFYNRFKVRRNPQRRELENVFLEMSRVGIPQRSKIAQVKSLLAKHDCARALELASEIDFDNIVNVQVKRFLDFSDQEKLVYLEARHVSLTTPQAIVSLSRAVDHVVKSRIPGALVECGVYRGGSIIAMLRTLLLNQVTDREVYLYDTFEGMPAPDKDDVFYTGEDASTLWRHFDGKGHGSNWVNDSLESVKRRVLSVGYPETRIHFIKGRVEDTIPGIVPDQIALLRLDTDFYHSTKHELVHLYPLLSRGGILILDDYGVFRGAQRATDEFIRESGTPMFLSRVDEAVRLAVKP
jgi:O-methyltransferase